ncbi:Hypothetical predicted protein [Lecanosticta acicola]|uniref:Uncharacterized protein n=1 Tax=Lecanosticta acicola TaxID=111012 RepID=A0AAI8YRZ5_9PEZI|nr:Hypothetical predicted protein [Lecanosticta acicola]
MFATLSFQLQDNRAIYLALAVPSTKDHPSAPQLTISESDECNIIINTEGPQRAASIRMCKSVDSGLSNMASTIQATTQHDPAENRTTVAGEVREIAYAAQTSEEKKAIRRASISKVTAGTARREERRRSAAAETESRAQAQRVVFEEAEAATKGETEAKESAG